MEHSSGINESVMEETNAIDQAATPPSAQDNINTVIELEEKARQKRTRADRLSDSIANFVGSLPFVVLHLLGSAYGSPSTPALFSAG